MEKTTQLRNKIEENKPLITIFLVVFILVVCLVIAVFLLSPSDNSNQSASDSLTIEETASELSIPDEKLSNINTSISEAVKTVSGSNYLNLDSDLITVRSESIYSNYDKTQDIEYGHFIIDIDSLKQSYYVQYEYSSDPDNYHLSGYPVLITCLTDEDEKKYPDFKCELNYN